MDLEDEVRKVCNQNCAILFLAKQSFHESFPINTVLMPLDLSPISAGRFIFGFRISKSSKITLLLETAITAPRFIAIKDLPSPDTVEDTAIIFFVEFTLKKSRLVRRVLIDSLTIDFGMIHHVQTYICRISS